MPYDLGCQCGATFRSPLAEARHRHNFPLLCRQPKPTYAPPLDGAWQGMGSAPKDGRKIWVRRKPHPRLRSEVALVSWHPMDDIQPGAGHWRNHAKGGSPVYSAMALEWQTAVRT